MEWAAGAGVGRGRGLAARDRGAAGDQSADGRAAGRGGGAAAVFAGAGGVDARSVGAGAAAVAGGVAGDQGAAGDGDPARGLRLRGLGRSGPASGWRELRPRPVRPAQRTGYRPGQVLQVDWAEMPTRPRIAGRERRVYALVCTLPFSGALDGALQLRHDRSSRFWRATSGRSTGWAAFRASASTTTCARRSRAATATQITWNPRFVQLRGHYAFHAHGLHAGDAAREGLGRGRGPLPQDRVLAGAAVRRRWPSSTSVYADWRDRVALPRRHATGRLRRRRAARARARAAAAAAAGRASTRPGAGRRGCRWTATSSTAGSFYRAPGGAGSSARRAALRPRPGLDRAPRPDASPLPAQLRAGHWQPPPRMRPEPPPVARADPDRRPARSSRRSSADYAELCA